MKTVSIRNQEITSLGRHLVVIALCFFFLMSSLVAPSADAISEEQRQLLRSGVHHYDLEENSGDQACYGPTELEGSDGVEQGYNFFISKGMEPIHAAGLIGNFMFESGMNPEAFNSAGGGQGAYGIAQWRSARQAALKEKTNYDTLPVQLEYVWEELQGSNSDAYQKIIETTNVEDAAVAVDRWYERSEQTHHQERINNAQQVLAEYGSGSGTSTSGSAQGGCTVSTLPDGESPELAQALIDADNVNTDHPKQLESIAAGHGPCPDVNNGVYTIDVELLRTLVALSENNSFTISSLHRGCTSDSSGSGKNSRHWRGKAVDISGSRPINGATMEGSFSAHSSDIQRFVNEAWALLPPNCELGVPNNTYISNTSNVESECENIFLDTKATTGATGPHIHIGTP